MNLRAHLSRIRAAWNLVTKGSIEPFNRLVGGSVSGGEKLTKPFEQSAWVMRAIKLVAQPISAVELKFATDRRGGQSLLTDPALMEWAGRPAVGLALADFIEANVIWLKLKGESFWVLDDRALVPFPEVQKGLNQVILARPDRMRHIVKGGELLGWQFTDGGGSQHNLLPEQVIQLKYYNPYDDVRGLAEYNAAHVAAEADYLAGKFQQNLMRNNGDRGPIISATNGIPDDNQREQIIAQLREKKELSQRGIFKPIFLSNDIKVEDPGLQATDAAWLASRIENRHEIFLALGVPPSLSDVKAAYSIGAASDRFWLIEETCMPAGKKITEGMELLLKKQTGRMVFVWHDWSKHSVMRQVRSEELKDIEALWSRGMPMQLINDYLELGLPEFEGWDVGYLSFSAAPVGEPRPAEDPQFGEDIDEGEDENTGEGEDEADDEVDAASAKVFQRARGGEDLRLWEAHMRARSPFEREYTSKWAKAMLHARQQTLAKVQAGWERVRSTDDATHHAPRTTQRALLDDLIFDLVEIAGEIKVEFSKVTRRAVKAASRQVKEEIESSADLDLPDPLVAEYLKKRDNLLDGVTKRVWDEIRKRLIQGVERGESIDKIAEALRRKFNQLGKRRARTIARTEVHGAFGFSRQKSMEAGKLPNKRWLTSGLPNVRHAHVDANDQVVAVTDPFDVGGEYLLYPGDQNGSPENIINCRCVSVATKRKVTA